MSRTKKKKKKLETFHIQKPKSNKTEYHFLFTISLLTFHPQVLRLLLFARWPRTSCLYYCSPSLTHIHRKNKFKNVHLQSPATEGTTARQGRSSLLTSLTLILMEKNEEIRIRRGNRRNFYPLKVWFFFFFLSFFERRKKAGSGSV